MRSSLVHALRHSHLTVAALGLTIFVLALGATFWLRHHALTLASRTAPALETVLTISTALHQSIAAMRGWVSLGTPAFRDEWRSAWKTLRTAERKLSEYADVIPQSERFGPTLNELHEAQWYVLDIAQAIGNEPARALTEREAEPLFRAMLQAITSLIDTEKLRPTHPGGAQLVGWMADIRAHAILAQTRLRALSRTGESVTVREFRRHLEVIRDRIRLIANHLPELTADERDTFEWMTNRFAVYRTIADQVIARRHRPDWHRASFLMRTETLPVVEQIERWLAQARHLLHEQQKRNRETVAWSSTVTAWSASGLFIMMILAALWLSTRQAERLAYPIRRLARTAETFAKTHHASDLPIERDDELGLLAHSFNTMRAELERSEQALLDMNVSLERRVRERTQTLEEREEQVRLLLESTAEGIYAVDVERNGLFCNRAALRMVGYPDERAVLGRNLHHLFHHTWPDGQPYPESEGPVAVALSSHEPVHREEEIVWRADGSSFIAELWARPIVHGGQLYGVIVSFIDVTRRKEAEKAAQRIHEQLLAHQAKETERVQRELEKAKATLVRHERLATLGQLAGSIAHELRNPLGAIRNAVYLLKGDQQAPSAEAATYLGIIEDEIQTCNRIITDLLEIARGKTPAKHAVDLGKLLRSVWSSLNPPSTVRLACIFDPEPFMIWADLSQMTLVFQNILRNAVQAVGDSGGVTVRASREREHDIVTIDDTGPGIPPDIRDVLFAPLVSRKVKGTGLGLTICQLILERHGGSIAWDESYDEGTRFRIMLPRAPREFHSSATNPLLPREQA